jgi:hypothetical protein
MGNGDNAKGAGEFARRVNMDGTIDSICLYCFRTVATSHDESALLFHQGQHICDALAQIASSDDKPQTTKAEHPPSSD